MIRGVLVADVERFRDIIARRIGLAFDDAKSMWLAEVLDRRLAATRSTAESYLSTLEATPGGDEIGALGSELTVPETYFFRNYDQYAALMDVAWPACRARSSGRPIQILSAGCATGEEAYTIAMLLTDAGAAAHETSVMGVDVSPAAIARARAARYSAWSLRDTAPAVVQRWFAPLSREFALDQRIRSAVRFEARNLADDDPVLWRPESYDIVFCRNVLMYFTTAIARDIVERIHRALRPGGYVFLGHAETMRGLSTAFQLCHTHSTFYYQRPEKAATKSPMPVTNVARPDAADAALPETSWVEAISRSAERIGALATAPRAISKAALPLPDRRPWNLAEAHDLLREERFAAALETVQALPDASGRDPDALLLRAALHAQRGELAEAERVCRRLLEIDGLSAGAHYLLALCREAAGDRAGAVHHSQVSAYLDPGFAMPRLQLGLLARRSGDRESAKRELGQAQILLQGEDPSRLLLFGGGFSRDALLALCRAELVSCGGAT